MNGSFFTTPSQVRLNPGQAVFGLCERCDSSWTGTNNANATAEVWTMAVNGSSASLAYGTAASPAVTIVDDVSGATLFSFYHTVGASDNSTTLHATSIVTAWNLSEGASWFTASNVAGTSNTITFTGRHIGLALTVAENDANLGTPSNSTNAGVPANILPGRLVIRSNTSAQGTPTVKHPVVADFTAQVITYTYGSVGAADVVQATIYYRGETISEKALYTASQTATLAALASALNTAIDARWGSGYSIAVTSDATTVVFTAEVAGDEFDAASNVVGAGAGTESKAWTAGPSSATSLRRRQRGFAMYHGALKARQTGGDLNDLRPVYRGYDPVQVCGKGLIYAESTQTISNGDAVYIGVDTTNPGKAYNAAAANTIWMPVNEVQWDSDELSTNGQGVARLIVNL